MNSYDEEVKALQAKDMADLQKELNESSSDPLKRELDAFLMALVQTRLSKKLSQTDLAGRLGMQQPAIARIETGHGNPSLRTLLAIAKALDANLVLK